MDVAARLRTIDLRDESHAVLSNAPISDAAGDVNGDGQDDVVTGYCGANNVTGWSKVLFGPLERGAHDVREIAGFRIEGWSEEQWACKVAAAGDVNGDGLDDVLVGAYKSDNNAREDSGTVYVIFGKEDSEPVHLKDFDEGRQGMQGFRIDGPWSHSLTGYDIDFGRAGDVNNDGYADVIVGAVSAGSAYVVFGQPAPVNVDLLIFETGSQGPRGFRIDFRAPDRSTGLSVSGAGDTNGDGLDDVIVGLIPRVNARRGQAHVVFGKTDPLPVDLRDLGEQGFSIRGVHQADDAGHAVSAAGDVNDDGLDDVLISAPKINISCCPGAAYIVFGRRTNDFVRLKAIRGDGYKIKGEINDGAGLDVANAGDLNGDGLPDQIVGSMSATPIRPLTGAVYVVFGKRRPGVISVAKSARGYRIIGARKEDDIGYVGGPGDYNGDGANDILFSTPYRGKTYIVFGGF
jgi:hypothetical protein